MLKKALIRSLNSFSGCLSLAFLMKLSSKRLFMPFYHTVSDDELPHIQHLYHVRNSRLFIKDLEYILKHYRPVDLHQLTEHIEGDKLLPEKSFFLSFDDGLSECYSIIAPILKQKGIPATFFLNSDFVDNKGLMFRYKSSLLISHLQKSESAEKLLRHKFKEHKLPFRNTKESLLSVRWNQETLLDEIGEECGMDFDNFLKEKKPYLTTPQIVEMISDGFTFGSHSQNHPTYNKLSPDKQIEQTVLSQEFLCKNFGLDYKAFAFPFTDSGVSAAFFERILKDENFQLTFGGAGLKNEKIKGQLQRFGMEKESPQDAKQQIHSEYCYYLIKSIFGKNVIRRD